MFEFCISCNPTNIINTLTINKSGQQKFYNDCIFYEDEEKLILLEGVILNIKELNAYYKKTDWLETILHLYRTEDKFYNQFRGSFSGVIIDKINNKSILFNDHIGSKRLYYYSSDTFFICSNNLFSIVNNIKNNHLNCTLNIEATYHVLSFGYIASEDTLVCDLKRVLAGTEVILQNKDILIENYYILNPKVDSSKDENIYLANIDQLFSSAIQKAYNKDLEYGYSHVANLSGGLDSRMTNYVAHNLGYKNVLNLTFSQSDYIDEYVPKKISAELNNFWIFHSLDNGEYLKNIRNMSMLTHGVSFYAACAHVDSLYEKLNFDKYGVIHTGQLGDAILSNSVSKYEVSDLAYSKKLLHKIDMSKVSAPYLELRPEIRNMYIRGFLGTNTGLVTQQYYSETYSPFYDVEFMEYCLSIPLSIRDKHELYYKWINKFYPKAANHDYEKIGAKINSFKVNIFGRKIPLRVLFKKIIQKVFSKNSVNSKNGMNPFDYWYKNNTSLQEWINDYFNSNINIIIEEELRSDMVILFKDGNLLEKTMVLSVLDFYKIVFVKEEAHDEKIL